MKLALQLRPLSGGNARQGDADDGFGGACPKSTPPFTLEALLSRCTAPLGVDREALSNYLDTMCREPLVEMATTCVATHSRFHGFPMGCDRAAPYPPLARQLYAERCQIRAAVARLVRLRATAANGGRRS